MSSDRLRRLDALFAEKVLGYTTEKGKLVWTTGEDEWRLTGRPGKGDILLPYPRPMPRYTRSLDAAWEGVTRLTSKLDDVHRPDGTTVYPHWCLDRLGYDCCRDGTDPDGVHGEYRAVIAMGKSDDTRESYWFTTADHPAEALVLACLRAVGVAEEELG